MAGACSICTHDAVNAINAALLAHTVSVVSLAQQHGTTRDLLNWHRRRHLQVQDACIPPAQTFEPASLSPGLNTGLNTGPVAARTERRDRARETFLKVYAQCGNLTTAAKAAHVGRTTVYQWQEHDPEFSAAFKQADLSATESLEKEAWRRARDGIEEPVYQHGKLVGTVQRYSDALLMFLLRARDPRYRDRVDVSVTPVIKAVAGFDPADVT